MLARGLVKGTICCVLKSGGDFTPAHVAWLKQMCHEKMPDWDFCCWSDMDVPGRIPLKMNLPKWWSKMEIYRTEFGGPALVIDLDTVFLKEFTIRPEHEDEMLVIRCPWKNGFRSPERLAGGFMYLPPWSRAQIWQAWRLAGEDTIGLYDDNDQIFLHKYFADKALRIQDHYIDEVVSYKVHVLGMGLQSENKVVYFHGEPRPWNVDLPWIPKCSHPDQSSAQAA